MQTATTTFPNLTGKSAARRNRLQPSALEGSTTPEPAMEDDRITRIARALCRSARIDPDSILTADSPDAKPAATVARTPKPASEPVPAWTMFRSAALTFIHSHDEHVVSPL